MPLKLLLICYFDPLGLLTVQESVNTLKKYSKHNIQILNLYPNLSIQQSIDLSHFNGIILHNTVAYNPQTLYTLDKNLSLSTFKGLKILFKQDEHVRSHETAKFIGQTQIDLVLTCLLENEITKVYPKALTGDATFLTQYTSYISDDLMNLATTQAYVRSTDIAYRGSIQPLQCGVLGYEKWKIGDAVQTKLNNSALKLDISSTWSNRVHGTDWIKFLLSSKATLGVESGSNLFDFTGEVELKCKKFEEKNKPILNDFEALYHKAHREFLNQYEDNVHYAQISPRHFEAAATKTLQILYEGAYSDIFVPYKHYLPLKRDLSNIEEVLELLSDTQKRQTMTACAFEEIANNPKYHIAPFVERFDETLNEIAHKKTVFKPVPKSQQSLSKKNIVMLVPHKLLDNPRVKWLKETYAKFSNIICIGIINNPKLKKYIMDGQNQIHLNLAHIHPTSKPSEVALITKDYNNIRHQLSQFSDVQNIQYPDNSLYSIEARTRHQNHCKHILSIDFLFEQALKEIIDFNRETPDLIVSFDLSTLLSGVSLSQYYHIPLAFDAHQSGPYSNEHFKPFETDFWLHYESTLLKYVDLPISDLNSQADLLCAQSKHLIDTHNKTEKITDFDTSFLSNKVKQAMISKINHLKTYLKKAIAH